MSDERALVPSADRELAPVRSLVVNGRRCAFAGEEISHAQLVRLAYPGVEHESGRSFTVTYAGGPVQASEGILTAHRRTPITDGESFNVALTDKS